VLAVVVLLIGLALGRFVLFTAGDAASDVTELPGPADTVATLEQRVADAPADLEGLQELGIAYTQRAAETGDPAFYRLAERAFDRADEIEPGTFETLVGRGALALSLHDFAGALEVGTAARELAPDNANVLGILIDAQVELGHYTDAAETLQVLLDRNPALPALARTSYLRELSGDLTGATRAMQQAIGSAAGSGAYDRALVTALLGNLQLVRGDVDAAAASFDTAAMTLPTLVEASIGRARVAVARGDLRRGIAILEPVVDRIPRPDAVIVYADLLRLDGRESEAEDADELARTLSALQAAAGQDVDLELALFEATRGDDPDRAVALAEQAHEVRPDNVFAAESLAWALHRAGRSAEALELSTESTRLGSAVPHLRAHAALIADAAGEPAAARAQLESLFAMSPWTVPALHADIVALASRLQVDVPPVWALG
jgi:tetratricopeptide (TPR) repeat protein